MPSKLDLAILGTSGLKRSGGWVLEEWHRRLQGPLAVKVYEEMSTHPVLGGILFAIEILIRQASWRVEPADDSDEAKEWAVFLEECMEDTSHTWDDLLSEVLTMLRHGWSYFETVYKIRGGPEMRDPRKRSKFADGRIGWRKLAFRSQDSLYKWEFDEDDGAVTGMHQMDMYVGKGPVYLPLEKSVLFRTKSNKGNPEGRSMLRNSCVPYWRSKNIEVTEGIGTERDLAGLPVMEVPPEMLHENASSELKTLLVKLQKLIQEIRRDEREGIIMPSETDREGKPTGFKLSLLTTGGRRQLDTNAIINRYVKQMAMSMLAEFILLGMDKVGSFALADSKTHLFAVALGGIMDSICEVYNRYAVTRLMDLNQVPIELRPYLVHGDVETPDLDALGKFVTAIAGAGVLGSDTPLERKLLESANLPVPEQEE